MDVIEYINTITVNNFSDWVRCHNNLLHNNVTSNQTSLFDVVDDKEIRIIGHILKILYNEKISVMNKYYLLISIEENLEYFILTENGAIHMVQSLTTDLKNILQSKWDHRYTCQLITVICSCAVYYDLFLSLSHQCASFIYGLLSMLFNIISNDSNTTNWTNLKYTALTSLLHLETTYPTLLSQHESRLINLLMKEKSIHFELLLQICSLTFRNNVLNKCRLQQNLNSISTASLEPEIYNNEQMLSFIAWSQGQGDTYEEKIVGSQSTILKSLRTMLDQAMTSLSPLAINAVVRNCLQVTNCLSQQNTTLWTPFIGRFICSLNLNILEALLILKNASKSSSVKDSILQGEQLQETLLAVLNNCRLLLPKRQVVAQWLYRYPLDERTVYSVTVSPETVDTYTCYFEPELLRHFYLRSVDLIEIKYCRLMLLNRSIKTSTESDCNSYVLYSSLKEIIKSLHYFDSDMPSNILLRIMFAMHIRHPHSVLARDFESSLENIVVRYPKILSAVMFYLNGLEKYLTENEQSRNFSVKCLTQIARLSCEKLSTMTDYTDFSSIRLHIQVLDYVIKFTDIDMADYLAVLHELLTSCKRGDNTITWFEEANDLVLNLCFNIISKYGSSKFYLELTNILTDIRNELFGNGTEIKADFLYALVVSLPSKKTRGVLRNMSLKEITEKDFELLQSTLIESFLDYDVLTMRRKPLATTLQKARFQYNNLLNEYLHFLGNNNFTLLFDVDLLAMKDFKIEKFLYGVCIEFQTDSSFVDIAPWNIALIRCTEEPEFHVNGSLQVSIKEPETFTIYATLAATKHDGTFVISAFVNETIVLLEQAINVPIEFSSDHSKTLFLCAIYKDRLLARSFVSINLKTEPRLTRFTEHFDKFVFLKEGEAVIYLMFLPPLYHIVLKTSVIGTFRRRVDVFTDLKLINLLSIEESLKHFEL